MSVSSDTESECEGSVSGWKPMGLLETSAPVEPSGDTLQDVSQLQNALETLSNVTICAIEGDQRALEQVWIASSTIRWSLDRVISFVPSDEGGRVEEVEEILRLLLDPLFLTMLFKFRAAIYDMAARNPDGQALIVSGADLILAKLGRAVITAVGSLCGVCSSYQDHPSTIISRRDDDMLLAATQLPDCWSKVAGVMCSEYHSPAAVRLATSLIFGVNVMLPQMTGDILPFDHQRGQALLQVLDNRLKQTMVHGIVTTQISIESSDEHDRIMFAMFVSLYAMAASADSATFDLAYRPRSCATFVSMIQAVLQFKPNEMPLSVISPPLVIDNATAIMVKWGMTIPWSWTTWMDGRLHDSDVIEHLSVVWLHTVHLPPDATFRPRGAGPGDYDLTTSLTSHPLPALSMMTRLLFCALHMESDVNLHLRTPASKELVAKLCWSVKYLLQIVQVHGPSLIMIYGILCQLFAFLPDGEAGISAKNSILEALSLFPSSLKVAADIFSDPNTECWASLNEIMLGLLTSSRLLSDNSTCSSLRVPRQTAQFLSLIWMAGTPQYFNPDITLGFLSALCGTIDSGSLAWRTLGDAAIVLLSVVKRRRDDPIFQLADRNCEDQSMWKYIRDADPADLLIASSFAAYVCVTAGSRSSHLLWADAWSYFCDALLLILEKGFVEWESEEPLGLFIAPGICRALLSLVEVATDHAFRYCVSSPWTNCLMTQLRKIRMLGGGGEDYGTILGGRISSVAELLCNHLERRSDSAEICGQVESISRNAPSPVWKPVFCFIRSVPCVILGVS